MSAVADAEMSGSAATFLVLLKQDKLTGDNYLRQGPDLESL